MPFRKILNKVNNSYYYENNALVSYKLLHIYIIYILYINKAMIVLSRLEDISDNSGSLNTIPIVHMSLEVSFWNCGKKYTIFALLSKRCTYKIVPYL